MKSNSKTAERAQAKITVCLFSTHPLVLPELQRYLGALRAHSVTRLLKITSVTDLSRVPCPPARVYVVDSHSTGPVTEGLVSLIRSRRRNARVVVLSDEVQGSRSFPFLHLGVKGLVRYQEVSRQLPKAVRMVAKGGFWIPRKVMSDYLALLQSGRRASLSTRSVGKLSRREKEVLELVLKSLSNKEISSALNISESTVKFHVSNIFHHYGVQRRADLILQSAQGAFTIQ